MVGDGCYAKALATCLAAGVLRVQELRVGPAARPNGVFPRVFENLKRVCLVLPEDMSAAETLRCHQSLWNWVEKLSSAGDQHDLAFIFILPADVSSQFTDTLAVGLGVDQIDLAATGHGVWRRSGSLSEMLHQMHQIRPMDLLTLRARRAGDAKRHALAELLQAVAQDDLSAASTAARKALAVFSGQEYHLDIFCRPPSHHNGNLLRCWLNTAVTESVTQDWWTTGKKHLIDWLAEASTNE